MSRKEHNKDDDESVNVYSTDLPSLKFERVRSISDFEVERFSFVASGVTMKETKEAMDYLLKISKYKTK